MEREREKEKVDEIEIGRGRGRDYMEIHIGRGGERGGEMGKEGTSLHL